MNVLQIDKLQFQKKSPWTFCAKTILKNISLEIGAGEAFGFLGHNGAGKTTTIKCILNLCVPTAGSIRIFGKNSADPTSRKDIAYLPEQPYFYENLTVEETLLGFAKLCGLDNRSAVSNVQKSSTLFSLTEKLPAKIKTLSKGQLQRVGLAQLFLRTPKLLILDEPFSGLDPIERKNLREILFTLKKDGTTIFMSSHALHDVEQLCDRASILVQGELKGIIDLTKGASKNEQTYEITCESFSMTAELVDTMQQQFPNCSVSEGARSICFSEQPYDRARELLQHLLSNKIKVIGFEPKERNIESIFEAFVRGRSDV